MAWSRSDCAEFCFATSAWVRAAFKRRELERRLRIGQIALCLIDVGLKNNGIDLRDHLPRFHDRIKVREELLDVA